MYPNDLEALSGQTRLVNSEEDSTEFEDSSGANDSVVSFQTELPAQLQLALTRFIERYPNWDQYRLIQAALAGFLVQNGVESRSITRLYLGNMFCSEALMKGH